MFTPCTDVDQPPLRQVRIARGLTLQEVATRAQVDAAQLSRVETGKSGLSVNSLFRVAQVLGLTELVQLLQPYVRQSARRAP
ncbi:helix-turn-helix domain-containing protein [Euzebya pacifica]|uniref:helix-turn-helix domain-containing protein n=1 Tax=Euzebya pacifica TaxID=1608957 RepID=UPI000DF7BE3D